MLLSLIIFHFFILKELLMSFEFILRIVAMFILAIGGGYWGFNFSEANPATPWLIAKFWTR